MYMLLRIRAVFFFFSSRRRHTRSLCDWSSDVCSSDLSCTIKEFGYLLREKIISKWHRLNGEFELNEAEITRKVTQSGHLLNSVVGKGLFPSHPFFIFYVLKCSEAEPQSVGTQGSYGHVYKAFLTSRFENISTTPPYLSANHADFSLVP